MNDISDQVVGADEQVLLVVHRHWASFMRDGVIVFMPGLAVLAILLTLRGLPLSMVDVTLHAVVTILLPLSFLILWIILGVLWTTYYLDMLIVTDRRIFYTAQVSLISRSVEEWRISDVRHAGVRFGGALESFFNYGTLILQLEGSDVAAIENIPNPDYVSAVILKQDDRYGTLVATAKKQEELLRFLSHEVKGHLAKSKAAFAAIVQGDYGAVPAKLSSLAAMGLQDSQKGVDTVMSILDPHSKNVQGNVFDLSTVAAQCANNFLAVAAQKGLSLRTVIEPGCMVRGDGGKIGEHVIRNLIDNAIHYTPHGQVEVTLKKEGGNAVLAVADTGIGISPNDMPKLFTQGGRGELSRSINPESTGYGLYIAKQTTEANGGRIGAHSMGQGSGSQFIVELPLAN